jgi:mannosyltransferase
VFSRRRLAQVVNRLAPWLVLGLGAGLRLVNLAWKSVDNDEAFSWANTHKPMLQLISDSLALRGDPHPPVYWVTLKLWLAATGDSELALRLFTALTGIVCLALVYALGKQLFSRPAGIAAALFAALSPWLIWNSQDARMYTLGGTLALGGLVCLVQGLRPNRPWRWLAGYFALTLAACYTHIAGSFLLPFEGLIIVISALGRRPNGWRAAGRAIVALGAIGLGYLPFAFNAWRISGPDHNVLREMLSYPQLVYVATLTLSVYGGRWSVAYPWPVFLLLASLFILGLLLGDDTRHPSRGFGRIFSALYYLAPLGVIYLLSLREPVYIPQSLTFMGIALALGVGAGWARIWRWQRAAGLLVGVALIGVELNGTSALWQPAALKEDWRNAAQVVAHQSGPNDEALIYLAYYRDAFNYYFKDARPVVGLATQPSEADAVLPGYKDAEVLWFVQSGEYIVDPDHLNQKWLEAHYPETTELYPSGIIVKGFAVRYRTASLPPLAIPAQITYSNGLTLAGYRIPETTLPVNDIWLHPPSTWVHVVLYWSVAQPLAEAARITVNLEDEAGNVWGGNLPRPNDLEAFYPSQKWQPGEVVRQDFDVNTNPQLAPGRYKVVLRVYPAGSDTARVNSNGEDWFILERVTLTR